MGRGKSNKIGSPNSTVADGGRSARETTQESRDVSRRISQAKFIDNGGGQWEMDISDIGGGAVLDETGSTRAYREGFMPNQKLYSASSWVYNENGIPTVTDLGTFTRRNQAQKAIKDALKGNRRGR